MPGKIMSEADVHGRPIKFSKERYIEAVDGYDIFLTLDETIQFFTEKALEQAVLDYNLKRGAAAIVMDPNTGEILAMASYPDFDPNHPDARPGFVDDSDWLGFGSVEDTELLWKTVFRNKAVNDTYEPGSTFKAITAAAALEEGVVTPGSQCGMQTLLVGRAYHQLLACGRAWLEDSPMRSTTPATLFVRKLWRSASTSFILM